MNLNGERLDEWFLKLEGSQSLSCFPHGENYFSKYKQISQQLFKWVHPEVGVGAASSGSQMLTNHGSDHIKTLFARVTQFIDENDYCTLNPFEIYVLLMAIHVHDVGNILGRERHEFNSQKIIEMLGDGVVGQDYWIWEYVYDIAKAHKGYQIEMLPEKEHLHEIPFRPQILAAMLKFADELAENFSRASNVNIKLENVRPENLLYHMLASTINTILPVPKGREVKMIFNIREDQLKVKYKKGEEEIYLVDEIYLRTLKTHSEKIYCSKFMRPTINFDVIKVTLNIKLKDGTKIQRGYELKERVIESITLDEVHKILPELNGQSGREIHELIEKGEFTR